jgi:mRNA interferase RelE/StbE
MPYRVEFSKRAEKQFKKLPSQVQQRLRLQIDALSENPHPAGVKKLEGEDNQYRIRVGNYRIVYAVQEAVLLVILLRIGHRREVYRKL